MTPAAQWRPLKALLGGAFDVPDSIDIVDITLDSRTVRPGSLFLACRGRSQHGLAHAREAAAAGARAILWEPSPGVVPPVLDRQVLLISVPDLHAQAGYIADRFFAAPSAKLAVAGVTGTNGKSTCAWLLADALSRCGRPTAYFGTLGHGRIGSLQGSAHTTPDAVTLQRWLAEEVAAGTQAVAMEVSSHALDQDRCAGVRFQAAAFTNLTRDHLDYHGDMAAYAAAKAKLFEWPRLHTRVLNIDDPAGRELALRMRDQEGLWVTSRQPGAALPAQARFVRARQVSAGANGLELLIDSSTGEAQLRSPLLGEFNAENLLTVLALMLGLGVDLPAACAALAGCRAPAGRMEALGGGDLPLAVVDYAHTPDALQQALSALRAHTGGRLWCVFGCGGERDTGKRAAMGAIAARLADHVLITDDNPRSEDPAAIAEAILAGMPQPGSAEVIHDRAAAIASALARAQPNDTVLIAGKGHEDMQQIDSTRLPFSDVQVARAALSARSAA
jgi:UDP-N-acetylmuramoyl-L-alanyl-D-glutamate--2,6-diaminopimelate ligase